MTSNGEPDAPTALRSASDSPTVIVSPPSSAGRFTPGTILGNRYRIIAMLGRGGMGEVYRADDLKLDQEVALKFLPRELTGDPDRFRRLLAEVRIGRQISHPNVCRIFDMVESEGRHFISMEYVDGEDLDSLLRRVGRLPYGKAIEIGRQICSGIAAVHDRGIIHRDLKPANVMIDGRGRARITDFGLASLGEVMGPDALAGTPAYMAPEQLLGREATPRSDVYSLGLILYEILTGRRLYSAVSIHELEAQHRLAKPRPSSIAREVDPAFEAVILSCLEEEPEKRPASARALLGAMSGVDPLDAVVGAGETPSPDMIAAAADVGSLPTASALVCLAFVIAGFLSFAHIRERHSLHRIVRIEKPPDALADRAGEIAARLGYDSHVDAISWFDVYHLYIDWIARRDSSSARWERLRTDRPGAIRFFYRQSPDWLHPLGSGAVGPSNPPLREPGMIALFTDLEGRLLHFTGVPPRYQVAGVATTPPWPLLFEQAGLDIRRFTPAEPRWTPPVASDEWRAWEGSYIGKTKLPIRVEAAALRGKLVFFAIEWPWTVIPAPERVSRESWSWVRNLGDWSRIALTVIAIFIARMNWKARRGDRRGAGTLAFCAFVIAMVFWAASVHHVPTIHEMSIVGRGVGASLFAAAQVAIAYLAFEPFVRRRWPRMLIGWSRLLEGRFADPMIGRDVLAGLAAGVLILLVGDLKQHVLTPALGLPPPAPALGLTGLGRTGHALSMLLSSQFSALAWALVLVLALLLIRWLVRSDRVALGIWIVACGFVAGIRWADYPALDIAQWTLMFVVFAVLLWRFGLLAFFVGHSMFNTFGWSSPVPLTLDPSNWYFRSSLFLAAGVVALAVWAFHVSLARRPLLSAKTLEG